MEKKYKVLVAENEPSLLRGICKVITSTDDKVEIVATAMDGKEALDKILESHPDIVFSDIKMPVMDGLEMLANLQKNNLKVKCILLTGYAKFEYAQKAVEYGAVYYLLKPINLTQLKKCLQDLEYQIDEERKQNFMTVAEAYYHQNYYYADHACFVDYSIVDCFYGCIARSGYEEFNLGSQIVCQIDRNRFTELEKEFHVQILVEKGYYQNELVLLVLFVERRVSMDRLIERIYQLINTEKIFLNIAYKSYDNDYKKMSERLNKIRIELTTKILFGKDGIWKVEEDPDKIRDNTKLLKKDILNQIEKISVSSSRYELKEISLSLTAYWQRAEAAQIHIMEDMRVLFHYLWKITPIADQNPTDITEICFASADYKELEDNLYSEMIRILFCYNKKPADQDILSHKIKEYLDLHLTESIVFSNLDKVFGYNVKYISGVFKNQYLMSPSKYVVNARINLAKKILDENEGIMLKDVARMVGYDDALYFSRVFKAQTGISPSQYIKTTEHSKD